MELINDCQLPYPIYKALCNDPYTNGGADHSVSSLYNGPKMIIGEKRIQKLKELKKTKSKELYEQLQKLFPAELSLPFEQFDMNSIVIPEAKASERLELFEGSMYHDGLEHRLANDEEFIVEKRLKVSLPVNGKQIIISGAFDVYCKKNNTLYDHKTIKAGGWKWRESKLKGYGQQLNIYRLLMKLNNVANPQEAKIIFMVKGWNELDAKTHGYPPRQYMLEDVPLMPDVEIIQLIKEKVTTIESYMETPLSEIPYCEKDQRWEGDPVWKICKKKADGSIPVRPRAIPHGKFETLEAANQAMRKKSDDYFIHEESGLPKRCFKYCNVYKAGLCDYPEVWTANRSEAPETAENLPFLT